MCFMTWQGTCGAWFSIICWSVASVAFCQNDPVFRSEARFVIVDVQVLSHNQPIIGLLQKDFLLHDDGVPQTITNFGSEDQPLDIMLLVDVSSSTDEIDAVIQNEAAHAMDRLRKGDRVGVAVFANAAYLAIPLTAERDQLIAGISNQAWRSIVPRQGVTELNRTTLKTANYLRKNARAGARRAIVVLTDNQVAGYVSENAAREALREADAVLSAIVFAGMPDYGSRGADVRPFAQATGGEVMKAGGRGSKLAEMFDRLRKRYVLLYRAPESKPGSIHTIGVELATSNRSGDIQIRGSGYRSG
jgi:VWFA-related protein